MCPHGDALALEIHRCIGLAGRTTALRGSGAYKVQIDADSRETDDERDYRKRDLMKRFHQHSVNSK